MYFNGGKGANLSFDKYDCRKKFSLMISLLFIAPLKFLMLEFMVAIGVCMKFLILVFLMPCKQNAHKDFDVTLQKVYHYIFNMDKS